MDPIRYKEKSVIIHRDESGFGFRVGGQNPVFVDCVHENGAAWKAGVRKKDKIIKVNGTLVRSYDHQRVVHMIQNCTPFVNLTLHSPEPLIVEPYPPASADVQVSSDQIESGNCSGANNGSINPTNNNSLTSSPMKVRLHPNSVSNNLNWLLDIGDDLFQDSQQHKSASQQQVNVEISPSHQSSGVSKLVEFGPTISNNSFNQMNSSSSGRPKLRQNIKNQSSTRDNPYYYYKTAPEKVPSDATTCNTSNSSFSNQPDANTSKSSAGLSIVRSRSSSKMSTRSSSGKYKSRKLRSRLVGDFRSLTIANMQTTPSSLSTSPSSSDLSNCDYDPSRPHLSTINSPSSSGTNLAGLNSACLQKTLANQHPVAPKSKQATHRLEIIRELVDTEKTHTERLKHLNDLVYKPIKAEGLVPADQLKMIFSCHKTLFKIHRQIYKILSAAQLNICECHQEPLVGRALIEIFEGELGKRLEKAASTFCACQSVNTDLLNRFTRKDTKAGEFLAQVATQQMLGRLGIKDLLASCFQRLTKYPLLLENLLKATPTSNFSMHSKSLSEGSIMTKAALLASAPSKMKALDDDYVINNDDSIRGDASVDMTSGPEITSTTNKSNHGKEGSVSTGQAITTSATSAIHTNDTDTSTADDSQQQQVDDEYAYERICISRSLYQSRQILKNVNEAVNRAVSHNKLRDIWKKTDKYSGLAVIDIETQQIIHEGPLTLRLARRSFEVYVLLLTHYLIILTREGQDKYKLKYFTPDGKVAKQFSPIFNIDEHLATRDTATDENGFYLLCKREDEERIYEFASQSPAERAKWKEKIHTAQLFNFAAVPADDNTLTRYRDLITLASPPCNTIAHCPNTSANNILGQQTSGNDNNIIIYNSSSTAATTPATKIATATTTTTTIAAPATLTTSSLSGSKLNLAVQETSMQENRAKED